jgi:hypothetical protein
MNAGETVERDKGRDEGDRRRRGLARGYLRDDYSSVLDRLHMRAPVRRDAVQFIRVLGDRIRCGEITTETSTHG